MDQTERKGTVAHPHPGHIHTSTGSGDDTGRPKNGWAVQEARSPRAWSPLRTAGNAVLAGGRVAKGRLHSAWQPEATPPETRSLKRAWLEANEASILVPKVGELSAASVQNGAPQNRLQQLEERIQKLHLLEARMVTQYSSQHARDSTAETDPSLSGVSLPNMTIDDSRFLGSPIHQRKASTAGVWSDGQRDQPTRSEALLMGRPSTMGPNVTFDSSTSSINESGDLDLVRSMVQDEIKDKLGNASFSGGPKKELSWASQKSFASQDNSKNTTRSQAESDSSDEDIIPPVIQSGTDDDDHDSFPRSAGFVQNSSAETGQNDDNGKDALEEEERRRHEEGFRLARQTKSKPKTLDDAVPIACPYLLGGFHRRSPIRHVCFTIQTNVYWQSTFLLITVANSVYIATAPGYADELSILISWYFDLVCACIFGFEVLSGMIAYGAFQGPTTYVQNDSFHAIDTVCLFFIISEYALRFWDMWPDLTMRPFRMFRLFKPITKIKLFSGIKLILLSLTEGIPQLSILFGFLLLTIIGGDILTMNIYSTSMRRRCVTIDMLLPVCASDFSTGFNATCDFKKQASANMVLTPGGTPVVSGGYPFERRCKIFGTEHAQDASGNWIEPRPPGDLVPTGRFDFGASAVAWPKDSNGVYHSCQADMWRAARRRGEDFEVTQVCKDFGPGPAGNPQMGFSHFDNVFGATVSLLQVIAMSGYSDVWFRTLESDPDLMIPTMILFPMITIFDTFLLLGLFVAVVCGTYRRIGEEQHYALYSGAPVDEDMFTPSPVKSRPVSRERPASRETGFEKVEFDEDAVVVKDELTQLQDTCRKLSHKWYFQLVVRLMVLLHLCSIAADEYNATAFWKTLCYWANIGCQMFFNIECLINLIARGTFKRFWMRHKVECILAILSSIGMATGERTLTAISAVRGYRLMIYFRTLEDLLTAARASIVSMFNVICFIALTGLCFTVAGRYLFGNRMDSLTRSNFSTLPLSSLTMIQLFTGDSWSSIMYNAMQCWPVTELSSQFAGAFFILAWFSFSVLIVNNLFVAVILENFHISETLDNLARPGNARYVLENLRAAYKKLFASSNAALGGALTIDSVKAQARHAATQAFIENLAQKELQLKQKNVQNLEVGLVKNPTNLYKPATTVYVPPIMKAVASVALVKPYVTEEERNYIPPERVLYLFEPESNVRRAFAWLGRQALFDGLILACILASCFFLMIDPPYRDLDPNPLVPYLLMDLLNTVFTLVFSVEFAVRVLGQGLLFTRGAYLSGPGSGWNQIDTVVLVFAWLEELRLPGLSGGGMGKILRMGRAMKPLRLMKRNASMRLVIDALLGTIQPLFYVILFLVFTLAIFSCVGMALFGGRLYRCNDPASTFPMGKKECAGTWYTQNGIAMAATWENPYWFNFDSYVASASALFQISCFKYVHILWACMDATEVDKGPQDGASFTAAIFFIIYIVFGGLFVMNLFTGFVVDGFNANKGATEVEIIFGRYRRQLRDSQPVYDTFNPPQNIVSTLVRRVLQTRSFQNFSTLCIVTNVGFMLADHADSAGTAFGDLQDLQNYIFFWELVAEMGLCLVAYGAGGFYNDEWRFFDLLVCVGTSFGYISANQAIVSFTRMFRLARVIRLMIKFQKIKIILDTMVKTLPQLGNVVILVALVYSMCAVLGVQLFSTTRRGLRLGPTANFDSFAPAFLTVWQVVTEGEWMILMADCSVEPPYCTEVINGKEWNDCGSGVLSGSYFVLVKIVCEFIMLNLFIGLIIENFSYITEDVGHQEDDRWTEGPSKTQLENLRELFQLYDGATGCVPLSSLHCMLCDLPPPLGYRTNLHNKVMVSTMDKLLEHMIRAELNLVILQNRELAEMQSQSWMHQVGLKKPRVKQLFLHAVPYEAFFLTVTYWRLPRLLPDALKFERHARVQESARLAAALSITDFFRTVDGRRKRKRINTLLANRLKFETWALKEDSHRARREGTTKEEKQGQRGIAKEHGMPLGLLLSEPTHTHNLVLERFVNDHDGLPQELKRHNDLVKAFGLHMKVPQPINGIEVLKKMAADNVIVCQAIDPLHAEQFEHEDDLGKKKIDLLVADLEGIRWKGWHATNTRHETYFHPVTFSAFDGKGRKLVPDPWERMDFWLKSNSRRAGAKNKRMGSCIDFQSFITDDLTNNSTRASDRAICHLRINVGSHTYTSAKIKQEVTVWKQRTNRSVAFLRSQIANKGEDNNGEAPEVDAGDCVLNVLGYLPREFFVDKYMDSHENESEDDKDNSNATEEKELQ